MSTFSIRPYQLEDIDAVYAMADESREHVARWMEWMTPEYSRDDAARWVEAAIASWHRGEAYEHVIVDESGALVGSCGLNHLDRQCGLSNLGYWVRSSRLGEGAARQAALLLRDFAFNELGLNRLEIVVAVGNEFSRRVALGTGAVDEGILSMRIKVGGVMHDAHMHTLLNPAAKRADAVRTIGQVNWLDMIVQDPDRVSRFYTEVAGLTRDPVPEDETHTSYSLLNAAGKGVLGICDAAVFPNWVEGWLPYLDVPDFDARVAKVAEAGGSIVTQMTMDFNWKGQRFCLVRDPSGAPFMLCEAAKG
ncbi:MAG: GNAT family N-acetyltransferase [Verrucomicrobiaceae bacterium]|nr:MAG: GNAT family N-acetyltransferase [Verrucomicrobiaceae bacterium]